MKKVVVPFIALTCCLFAARSEASVFTLDSYTVAVNGSDPGLVLETDVINSSLGFTLDADDDPYEAKLFSVKTTETALNVDDLIPYSISVDFSFSSPGSFGGQVYGITGAFWLFGSYAYVIWNDPLLLAYGTDGLLQVTLSDAIFRFGQSPTIWAAFDVLHDDSGIGTVHAPEPSSLVLLGIGLAGVATTLRSRRAQRAGS